MFIFLSWFFDSEFFMSFPLFSDFPIPADFPNFMHNRMALKYYHLYADRFNLRQHVRFHTKVDSVVFADDYEKTGRWVVTVTSQTTGKTVSEEFDGVLVCTGHHCTPNIPEFEGRIRQIIFWLDFRNKIVIWIMLTGVEMI